MRRIKKGSRESGKETRILVQSLIVFECPDMRNGGRWEKKRNASKPRHKKMRKGKKGEGGKPRFIYNNLGTKPLKGWLGGGGIKRGRE